MNEVSIAWFEGLTKLSKRVEKEINQLPDSIQFELMKKTSVGSLLGYCSSADEIKNTSFTRIKIINKQE